MVGGPARIDDVTRVTVGLADLAALLRARQVRGYPECRRDIGSAWDRQIEILEGVARANLCAGWTAAAAAWLPSGRGPAAVRVI